MLKKYWLGFENLQILKFHDTIPLKYSLAASQKVSPSNSMLRFLIFVS
jgi:hypothetical protein